MPLPKDPQRRAELLRKRSERMKGRSPANKGKPLSDEHKAKLSTSLKGREAPNKGKPMSEEQKAKLSAAHKGQKHTDETKARIGKAAKGNKHSVGRTPWNKGVPVTEEQKTKISATLTGRHRSTETKAKTAASNRGKKRSPEFSKRMGDLHRGKSHSALAKERMSLAKKGKPGARTGIPQSPETRKRMSQISLKRWEDMSDEQKAAKVEILRNSTKDITKSMLEEVVALELDAQGLVYVRQERIGWYRVDFYIPEQNLIIEAQGCFWHACELCGEELHKEKRVADAKRYEYLSRKGFTLKVIWEHERQAELRKMRRAGGASGSG